MSKASLSVLRGICRLGRAPQNMTLTGRKWTTRLPAIRARSRLSQKPILQSLVCPNKRPLNDPGLPVSGICVLCSNHIKNITTRPARICRCRRTRRFLAPSRPAVRHSRCPSWAACTTNISEHEFPTRTGMRHRPKIAESHPYGISLLNFQRSAHGLRSKLEFQQ